MSTAIQFDTLRYVEKLTSAGIPEAQAMAKAEALSVALEESGCGLLATKDGSTNIKTEAARIKQELKLMTWMAVTVVAGVASLLAKAFLGF